MLDLVVVGMALTVPLMLASVALAKYGQQFRWHRRIQIVLAVTLLVILAAFELEMRFEGWRDRAVASPYWRDGKWNDPIDYSLAIHLLVAVPTPLLWATIIVRAVRHFPRPPVPGDHSRWHRRWGRWGVLLMTATAATGWLFYYLAFTAR